MHISNYILLLQANPPYRCIPVLLKKSADTIKFHLNSWMKQYFFMFSVYIVYKDHAKIYVGIFFPSGESMRRIFFVVAYSR